MRFFKIAVAISLALGFSALFAFANDFIFLVAVGVVCLIAACNVKPSNVVCDPPPTRAFPDDIDPY